MPQTAYNRDAVYGVPGQPFSSNAPDVIESRPALVAIQFGVLLEIVISNSIECVQPVQDVHSAWATATIFGVSVFDPAREQALPAISPSTGLPGTTQYAIGEQVPVMRKGLIWVLTDGSAAWSGTKWPYLSAPNVWHSSDGTHNQGVFTMAATVTTAGQEIDTCPTTIIGRYQGRAQTYSNNWSSTFNVAVVELNAPGTT